MTRATLYVIHYDAASGLPLFGMLIDAIDSPSLFGRWAREAWHND